MSTGANRPVRRRKSVSHYSDDNPNTFTVKPKKGDPPVNVPSSVATSSSRASTSHGNSVETHHSHRSNKQQSRQRHRDSTSGHAHAAAVTTALKVPPPTQPIPAASSVTASSSSSSSPRSFAALAVKSKTKSWKATKVTSVSRVSHGKSSSSEPSVDSKPVTSYRDGTSSRKRKAPTESRNCMAPAAPDSTLVSVVPDTILAHCLAIQPILPLRLLSPSHYNHSSTSGSTGSGASSSHGNHGITFSSSGSNNNSNKLGPTCAAQIPILADSHVALNASFKTNNNIGSSSWRTLVSPMSTPSTTKHSITWWSLRSDDSNYAAAGDCLGRVFLYRLDTNSAVVSTTVHTSIPQSCANRRPLKILSQTSAALRERHRVGKTTSKKVMSYYPNAIVQCAWCRSLVVVLTETEVELLQLVPTAEGAVRLRRLPLVPPKKLERKILVSQTPGLQLIYQCHPPNRQSDGSTLTVSAPNNRGLGLPLPVDGSDGPAAAAADACDVERYQILWTTWHREVEWPTTPAALVDDDAEPATDLSDHYHHRNVASGGSATIIRTNNSVLHWDVTLGGEANHTTNDSYEIVDSVKGTSDDTTGADATNIDDSNNDDGVFRRPVALMPHAVFESAPTASRVALTKLEVRDEANSGKPNSVVWATVWESGQSQADQPTFLMIAQTGPNTMELLRGRGTPRSTAASNYLSMGDDGMKMGSVDIVDRQLLPNLKSGGNQTTSNGNGNTTISADDFWPIADCTLQQSQEYVFVTSAVTRGIRMHRTDSLEVVATFGETVQLHGKLVQWNRCAWVRAETISPSEIRIEATNASASSGTNGTGAGGTVGGGSSSNTAGLTAVGTTSGGGKKKQSWWLERPDELVSRDQQAQRASCRDATNTDLAEASGDDFWLIGFPHPFKGPEELKTTLYLWKLSAATGLQSTTSATLQGPVGGCTSDVYVASGCTRMVCLGAETGLLYEWGPTVRSDFAGVMYPVGYKVISDNVEYVEDEDELDHVMAGTSLDVDNDSGTEVKSELKGDPELAEALRLSLLEHNAQEEAYIDPFEAPICVLLEKHDDNNGKFMVPCWPETTGNDSDDDTCTTLSPQRCRSFSSAGIMDEANAFELSFLNALPQTNAVRSELHVVSRKRCQQVDSNEVYTASEKPKSKGKRTRTATVEVLLQSSLDPDLRSSMCQVRGLWAEGRGSSASLQSLPKVSTTSSRNETEERAPGNGGKDRLALVQPVSDEEKALAMELLHLSPCHSKKEMLVNSLETTAGHPAVFTNGELLTSDGTSLPDCLSTDALVTPPEPSSEADLGSIPTDQRFATFDRPLRDEDSFGLGECMACLGRMVLHRCGLRSKPVDYDALARADEEEKQREADEKHRLRAERRRVAEARRRQSRRDKKMEEERKHIADIERFRPSKNARQSGKGDPENLEYHSYAGLSQPEVVSGLIYADSELSQNGVIYQSHTSAYAHSEQVGSGHFVTDGHLANVGYGHVPKSSVGYAGGWSGPRNDASAFHRETVKINGTEVTPSTSIDPMDALAALAGLADSISQPVQVDETSIYPSEQSRRIEWNAPPSTEFTKRSNSFEQNRQNSTDSLTASTNVHAQPVVQQDQSPALAEPVTTADTHKERVESSLLGFGATHPTLSHIDYRNPSVAEVDRIETASYVQDQPSDPEKPESDEPGDTVNTVALCSGDTERYPSEQVTLSLSSDDPPIRTLMPHEEFQAHALLALSQSASPIQQRSIVMPAMDDVPDHFLSASAPLTQASDLSATHKFMVAGFLQQPSSALLRSEENDDMLEDDEPPMNEELIEQHTGDAPVSQGERILDESQNQSIVATGSGCPG